MKRAIKGSGRAPGNPCGGLRLRGRRRCRPGREAADQLGRDQHVGAFVLATLWITKWAASRTRSAADFYTAGGGITGFQNGLAIAGDYMSAASLRHGADVRHHRLPHVLMRFFHRAQCEAGPASRCSRPPPWIGSCCVLIFFIGFGACAGCVLTATARVHRARGPPASIKGGAGAADMAAVLVAKSVGGTWSRLHLGGGLRDHPGMVARLTLSAHRP